MKISPSSPPTAAPIFLGFGTVEDLAGEVSPGEAVYVMALTTSKTGGGLPIGTSYTHVNVQALVGAGVVGYVRIFIGDVAIGPDSKPLRQEHADRVFRAGESAIAAVEAWLKEHAHRTARASFATPKDLELFNGGADFLAYDRDAGEFRRKEPHRS